MQLVEFIPADSLVSHAGVLRVIYHVLRQERTREEAAAWAMDWIGSAGQIEKAVLPGLGESLEDIPNALATVDSPQATSLEYLRRAAVELERGPFQEDDGA